MGIAMATLEEQAVVAPQIQAVVVAVVVAEEDAEVADSLSKRSLTSSPFLS